MRRCGAAFMRESLPVAADRIQRTAALVSEAASIHNPRGMESLGSELRALWRLALPVMVVQVGLMSMGVVDTMVAGHIVGGEGALAAVALGALYTFACMLGPFGIITAIDPLISQAYGARDQGAINAALKRGLWLAAALTVPASLAMLPGEAVFTFLGQPAEIIDSAALFTRLSAWGTLPFLLFAVLRTKLQATHKVRAIVIAVIAANVINLVLNLVLVLGWGGFEPQGVAGSAIATTISRWAMLAMLLVLGWSDLRPCLAGFWRVGREDMRAMRRITQLGLPIAGQFLLEWGAFGAAALLMGRMGPTEVEGHQVAVNLASFSFMFPLGVAIAASVRVGNCVGAGDAAGARRAMQAAYISGVGIMTLFAAGFLLLPNVLAALYTDKPASAAVAATLIPLAGLFQIFDGIQVVSICVLRGVGDTRTPLIMNVVGFWLFGVPMGCLLAFWAGFGPTGLWWGLVLGLGAVAILLLQRTRARLRGNPQRLC